MYNRYFMGTTCTHKYACNALSRTYKKGLCKHDSSRILRLLMNEPLKQFHRSRAPARGCPHRRGLKGQGTRKGMPLLSSEGVCTVYSRGSPCGYPGPCGCLPLFPSSGMTRFIRHRHKIWDESCLRVKELFL